jgi:hypothetical protein
MCVILQTWCQIQRTSSSLRNVNSDLGHIQCIYSSSNSGFIIQLNVCALLLEIYRQFNVRYTANLVPVPIQRITSSLRYANCGHGQIQCIYCSTYSGFNIQLDVSAPLLEIYRQFNALHTANVVPNIAHILQFKLCQLWSRTYTMYLLLHIFRLQYSTKRICAAMGDISTIQCALYCKIFAKLQRTSSSLRYLNCGLGHIQSTYSSAYSGFNIQHNLPSLLLEICRQFSERYMQTWCQCQYSV